MLTINSYEEFEKYLGQELGKSEWLEVDQDRILSLIHISEPTRH